MKSPKKNKCMNEPTNETESPNLKNKKGKIDKNRNK
jgi:hypothetical protein